MGKRHLKSSHRRSRRPVSEFDSFTGWKILSIWVVCLLPLIAMAWYCIAMLLAAKTMRIPLLMIGAVFVPPVAAAMFTRQWWKSRRR